MAQVTAQLTAHSEAGDWVGQGQDYSFDSSNAQFTAGAQDFTGDGLADYITISMHTLDFQHFWTLTFGTNRLPGNLQPGDYPDAERAAFASPGHPGLDVSGEGRGCNTLTGNFTITDAVFDYSNGFPIVVSFAASFEQHCEGAPAALRGTINFVDTTDRTPPTTTAALSGPAGSNGWYTGPVQVTLTATDPDGAADVAATFYFLDGFFQTYSGPFTVSGEGSHSLSFWSVDQAQNQEQSQFRLINIDATSPTVTATVTMQLLRTQKGNTAYTTVFGKIADSLSGVDADSATYSVQDEYGQDQPSGPVQVRSDGTYTFLVLLDAARSNSDKDGRTYVITVRSRDLAGNVGSQSVTQIVPRR
jgi:hypothetical protein